MVSIFRPKVVKTIGFSSYFSPYDKAGVYGIQEWVVLAACCKIEGSYFNVMGIPIDQVYRELGEFIKKDKR